MPNHPWNHRWKLLVDCERLVFLMLRIAVVVAFAVCTIAASANEESLPLSQKWAAYQRKYRKSYARPEAAASAFSAFAAIDRRIAEHNAQTPSPSYTLGHNRYSDLSWETFKAQYASGFRDDHARRRFDYTLRQEAMAAMDDSLDWASKGAVTHVKDQGERECHCRRE